MKKFVFMCLCGLAFGSAIAANPPSAHPALASGAAFEEYAMGQVVAGSVYVSSSGMNSSMNIQPYAEVATNVVDITKLLGLLASQPLTFALLHPSNDWVQTASYLRGADYNILFSGWTPTYKLVKSPTGKWMVPSNAPAVSLGFVGQAPVNLGAGAYGANLAERDANGNITGWQWIQAYADGKIAFPESWCGKGDLIVYYNDGTSAAYDLKNGGVQIDSEVLGLSVSPTLQNLDIVSETTGKVAINPVSQNGKGNGRIAQVSISFDRWMLCSGMTSEGERASAVVVHDLVNKTYQTYAIPSGQSGVQILFKTGLYHVYMEWENGFDEGDKSQPDNGGGGKG